jgi:hypothetical protein
MANIPVDSMVFSAFDMQELSAATFDAGSFFTAASVWAGDRLARLEPV